MSVCVVTAATTVACTQTVTQQGQTGSTTTSASAGGSGSVGVTATVGAGGQGGANIGQPSTKYPAPRPTTPIVEDLGGYVLQAPRIVPIFFANENPAYQAGLTDFLSKVGATNYWSAATKEYGVGAAVSTPPVLATEMPTGTIADADIQTWLGGKLNANDPSFPVADTNTVYIIYYPTNVTITLPGGGPGGSSQSCQSFGGYHSDFALDAAHSGLNVAYAVIPECTQFGGLTGIDSLTGTSSHELAEAATDPLPMTAPAYAQVDNPHIYWERLLGGGEVGDMCAQFSDSFTKFPELNYTVQRIWSNQSAKGGHDPCVPALPNNVYFNAAPVLNDNVKASLFGQTVTVKGVTIPVGQSKTIDIDLFSDGPTTGPWTVSANTFSNPPQLDLSLDASQGQNGQVLHLTINVLTAGKSKTETFTVDSDLNGQHHSWIGIVGSP